MNFKVIDINDNKVYTCYGFVYDEEQGPIAICWGPEDKTFLSLFTYSLRPYTESSKILNEDSTSIKYNNNYKDFGFGEGE